MNWNRFRQDEIRRERPRGNAPQSAASVTVNATPGCDWSVSNTNFWITIDSPKVIVTEVTAPDVSEATGEISQVSLAQLGLRNAQLVATGAAAG